MKSRNFRKLIENKWAEGKFVCVGLDCDYSKIPEAIKANVMQSAKTDDFVKLMHLRGEIMLAFNRSIIDSTRDTACAYKPNAAFYEGEGEDGIWALKKTIAHIHEDAPDVPVILDAKRADIGNTNRGYVQFAFDYLKADAITVHPYLGREALQPLLDREDKGVIVLCKTSNPGSGEFQDLHTTTLNPRHKPAGMTAEEWLDQLCQDAMPLYQRVAHNVAREWNKNSNCLVVVGATYPDDLASVRSIIEDLPSLIPGIGAQGGELEATVKAGKDSRGRGMIINSSRGIIFASSGPDFADAARRETEKLHNQITACLKS